MKTKGNWVIKTSTGGYWCGNAHFDVQLRKAQVYHWKEAAEEQIETIKRRKYMPEELEYEVVAISEPMELRDTEAEWIKIDPPLAITKYVCSKCGFNVISWSGEHDKRNCERSILMMNFCPKCGARMTNSVKWED